MLMTKKELARIAANTEESIKEISSVAQLKTGTIDGNCVDDAHGGEEYVETTKHPIIPGAYVISYFRRTGQTPLQIIINPPANYIKISLTCTETLKGYDVFDKDSEFGKFQDKKLPLDFAELHKELKKLIKE